MKREEIENEERRTGMKASAGSIGSGEMSKGLIQMAANVSKYFFGLLSLISLSLLFFEGSYLKLGSFSLHSEIHRVSKKI